MPNDSLKLEGWKEIIEVLGIVRGEHQESVPSVVLKTTANNSVQLEVKVYNKDADAAKDDACRIFDEIRVKYGLA